MRFFNPALSPMTNISRIPIEYALKKNPLIQSIWIASDLRELRLNYQPSLIWKEMERVRQIVDAELWQFPFIIPCQLKHQVLYVRGLDDINFSLDGLIKKLEREDPLFSSTLNDCLRELGLKDLEDQSIEYFLKNTMKQLNHFSLEQYQYFSLMNLRLQGVNHAVVLPLQGLKKKRIIGQFELNHLMLQTLLRVNLIRKEQEQKQEEKLALSESEFVGATCKR